MSALQDEIAGALKHTMSMDEAIASVSGERKFSSLYLWKVGIGEPGLNKPLEWFWVIAPDLTVAHKIVEGWMESTGWLDDTPLDIVVAAELISSFVLGPDGETIDANE